MMPGASDPLVTEDLGGSGTTFAFLNRTLQQAPLQCLQWYLLRDDYLNGAAYIRPPSVHDAFNPRARPRGVFVPTFFSNISP